MRRCAWMIIGLVLAAAPGLAGLRVQEVGSEAARQKIARTALTEAKQLFDSNRLPREGLLEIGVLQAVTGDLDGGLGTITVVDDQKGPGGPRWAALREVAQTLTAKGQLEAVQKSAQRQRASDRAALLAGIGAAQLAAGQELPAVLTLQELGTGYPAVAAGVLLDYAAAKQAKGEAAVTELLGRALDLARRIPTNLKEADGRTVRHTRAVWPAASFAVTTTR